MYKNKFLTGTEINLYRVFKITSIFAFALLSFIGGNAFAATVDTQQEAYDQAQITSKPPYCSVSTCEIQFRETSPTTVGYYIYQPNGTRITYYIAPKDYANFDQTTGEPLGQTPDPSECILTSASITLAGDSSTPQNIWVDGCQYDTGGVSACTTSDSWVTKQCSTDITATGEVREIDQTCTVENPCIAEPEPEEPTPEPQTPTAEQVDTAAEGEAHPEYDLPSNTEPDITLFLMPEGTVKMDVTTSDGCSHDITIDQEGFVTESITGTDCQAIIYQDRDYGNDSIDYSTGTNPPAWYEPSKTNSSGSTGGTNSTPTGIAPTQNSNDVDINTDDTPETVCDPATQDCSGLNTGLLSDIKELLSFDDQTPITDAATEFDTNLQSATDELELIGSQDIEVDGLNIDSLIKDVLRLPSAPPNQSNTFTLSGDFHIGTKSVEITNMYEKLEMLRMFLKWVFWITAVFSCYKILFSRPLM